MNATVELLKQLQETEAKLMGAISTHDKRQELQGKRDQLLMALTDNEGAHDRRPVAVR